MFLDCVAMPYQEHAKERFFKYTSASTALKILESSAVRYSSPLLFNDPFDVQSGLHFEFEIESLPEKIFQRIEQLVASDREPEPQEGNILGEAITIMWENKSTHGFPREEIRELIRPQLDGLKDQIIRLQSEYQNEWWNDFLPRLYIFSVAEENDNLLMWSHYGDYHRGVVFSFRVLPQQDNPLCVARPVVYRNTPPSFFTEQQWLDDILGVRKLEHIELYFQYAYVKSAVWAYEREWRVWDLRPQPSPLHYYDYPLWDKEVEAVYFGCNIASESKVDIMSLLSMKYPEAKLFQARKGCDKYRLEFNAI